MITVSQFMLIIWGFFLFCSSEASDPHLAVIAGDLGNATDWIQQEKAYGTPMHVKNSYESANILHMHVPQQTKIAYWKVRVNESHTICPARNVSLLLQHGSYPVTSIDGGKFPENFYFPLVTTYTLQSLSDSSLHWVNVTNPIPGHWYILAYLNSEDDRITQKDLAVKCLATVYIEGEYHVTNDVIIILPQVHDYQDIKLYQSVTGSQLYKFYVPSDTWRVRVNITKCLRVVHPDSDTSAEDMRGCSLLLSVSPAAFPNILRNNTMWKNCSEEAGDEGSCTLDFTPKEDAWHYLSVSAYGSTVSFALSVGYHSCSYEALEQQYMVMTELLPSHICASLLKSQNVNLDASIFSSRIIFPIPRSNPVQYFRNSACYKRIQLRRYTRPDFFSFHFTLPTNMEGAGQSIDDPVMSISLNPKEPIVLTFALEDSLDIGGTLSAIIKLQTELF